LNAFHPKIYRNLLNPQAGYPQNSRLRFSEVVGFIIPFH
jgi:hypothetical protein